MNNDLGTHALRVLVVEDVFLVAEEISDLLEGAGCDIVGPSGWVNEALKLAENEEIDGAILDVNLHGERCYPVVETLQRRNVPFIFLTGYDDGNALPEAYRSYPRLAKPIDPKQLREKVRRYFRPR